MKVLDGIRSARASLATVNRAFVTFGYTMFSMIKNNLSPLTIMVYYRIDRKFAEKVRTIATRDRSECFCAINFSANLSYKSIIKFLQVSQNWEDI